MTQLPPPPAPPSPKTPGAVPPGSARREIVAGVVVSVLFFVVFLGWAAVARLDAAVSAPGVIAVAGNRQSVQHLSGGIVRSLNVKEGDRVVAGQEMMILVSEDLDSEARAAVDQVIELEALDSRLRAELGGAATIRMQSTVQARTAEDQAAAAEATQLQQLEFRSRAMALSTQRALLERQIAQAEEQISGYQRQLTANREQQRLIAEEMAGLKELLDRGLVPMTRMRALQRTAADLSGDEGQFLAAIASGQQQINERRIEMQRLVADRNADAARELRTSQLQLNELRPKLTSLRQKIERATVRAPATGRVVGLSVFTVGGVVAPGQKIADIVPEAQPLVIDARIPPNDADDLKIGQAAEIRVTAFSSRRLPLLNGVVSKVSADSFTDEKTGAQYFKAEITVPSAALTTIKQVLGEDAGLRPGLPVAVIVPLGARTALSYFLDPLTDMVWRSFREH